MWVKLTLDGRTKYQFSSNDFDCRQTLPIFTCGETAGVNFINVLLAAFARPDPKSAKKTNSVTVFFNFLDLQA